MKQSSQLEFLRRATFVHALVIAAAIAGCGGAESGADEDEDEVTTRQDAYCVCFSYPCEPCGECEQGEESCRYSCDSPPACVPVGQCWASVSCDW